MCSRILAKFVSPKQLYFFLLHKNLPLFCVLNLFLLQFRLLFLLFLTIVLLLSLSVFARDHSLPSSGQCQKCQKRLQQPFITKRKLRLIMLLINDCFLKIYQVSIPTLPQIRIGFRTVFENHRKSLIHHCERSELRLHFEWTKVN